LLPARGALIDRTEHPEWRQFLIQAALRRAGEVDRLRDLRDTVIRSEPPVATMPAPAPVEFKLDVVEAPAIEAEPETAELKVVTAAPIEPASEATESKSTATEPKPFAREPKPVAAEPKTAAATPVEAKPETAELRIADATSTNANPEAAEPKPIATEPAPVAGEPKPAAAEPKIAAAAPIAELPAEVAPAPIAVKPESETPTQVASIAPALVLGTRPVTVAAPSPEDAAPTQEQAAAPASPLETNGSRIRADAAPPPATPSPAETKIAALPAQPVENDSDDITGTIEPAEHTATIPVGIGAASSTELLLTLPRARPPVLERLDLRRARDSKVKQPRRRVGHVSRAKKEPGSLPPELNLFALLFKAFDPEGNFEPVKPTIPYQPNNNWQK
jgi:hypothetical protein